MQSSTVIKLVVLLLLLPSCTALSEDGNSNIISIIQEPINLCDIDDIVYFSCETAHSKSISVCGKGDKYKPTSVYYRYGRYNKIELDYPINKDESSIEKFSYNYYFRAQVHYINITFNNDDYQYSIFESFDGESLEKIYSYGVNVYPQENGDEQLKSAEIKCEKMINGSLLPLVDIVSCDKNGTFGCPIDDHKLRKQ
jgi:hypothetical protein